MRQGRALFGERFPGECRFPFDAPSWDMRHLRTSQHRKTNSRAYLHDPRLRVCIRLPPTFRNVVKAYFLLNRTASASMILGADIARMLWEAVRPRFVTADAFDWSLLVEDDLLRTEQIMLIHWSQSTTYKRCTQLQFMLRVLAAARGGGIVRPMEVVFTTPRTDVPSGTRSTGNWIA